AWQANHYFRRKVDFPRHRARWRVRGLLRIDRNVTMHEINSPFAISLRDLVVGFSRRIVIEPLSVDVRRGEILGLVGASGGGKSVLMRTIIGLIPRQGGEIEVMGSPINHDRATRAAAGRWGILIQQGALCS